MTSSCGVSGSSGMLAARFDQVTVVERDELADTSVRRRGVPQGSHINAFAVHGRRTVEELLPGFSDDMISLGATTMDLGADFAIRHPFGWARPFHSDLHVVCGSRGLTELVIRRKVTGLSNVSVVSQSAATGLVGDNGQVDAVLLRTTDNDKAVPLAADLVVDATGRGSRAGRWLAELGCRAPVEETVDPHVGYASRIYRIPAEHPTGWKACYLQLGPNQPRGGMLLPIEDNQWLVTLLGAGPDQPRREDDFAAFARRLSSPVLAEAISHAEPLSEVVASRSTTNRRRHITDTPSNFVVVGDAACCFNPIYAQGMTMAAIAAVLLGHCLDQRPGLDNLAHRYYRQARAKTRWAWLLATTADARSPHTDGPPLSAAQRIAGRYLDRVLIAGTEDAEVQSRFLAMYNMLQPPTSLLAPRTVLRTLRTTRFAAASHQSETVARLPEPATSLGVDPADR